MDAFAERLRPIRDSLPVITKEIGDTWIYGVASDPQKQAQYRALLRLRQAWLASGASATDLEGFSGNLLLVPEHTNGLDVKTHLNDWTHYSRRDFEAVRGQPNFRRMEASWQEQRDYLGAAVSALPERRRSEAADVLAELTPARPDATAYERIADLSQPLQTEHFSVAFDPQVGSLIRLQSGDTDWAGPASPLGTFWYETYSAADYARYRRQYLINKRTTSWYARPDFTKPGIEAEASEHRVFRPRVTWSGRRIGDEQEAVLLLLDLPAEAHERFGAPGQLSIEVVFPRAEPRVDFVVQWFDKPASRLPEAAWFSFVLPDHGPRWRRSWRMDKLGEWVSPLDVVRNGNRRLHAVGSGLCADDGRARGVGRDARRAARRARTAEPHRLREPPARPARRSPLQPPQQPLGHRFPPVVRGRRAVSLQPPADPVSVVEPTRAATGPSSPFPKSQALFEAARAVIPGGVTSSVRAGARPHPLYLERGQGPYVWDVDGNRYVDYALGYGPLILGHAPVVVRDAIAPSSSGGSPSARSTVWSRSWPSSWSRRSREPTRRSSRPPGARPSPPRSAWRGS